MGFAEAAENGELEAREIVYFVRICVHAHVDTAERAYILKAAYLRDACVGRL